MHIWNDYTGIYLWLPVMTCLVYFGLLTNKTLTYNSVILKVTYIVVIQFLIQAHAGFQLVHAKFMCKMIFGSYQVGYTFLAAQPTNPTLMLCTYTTCAHVQWLCIQNNVILVAIYYLNCTLNTIYRKVWWGKMKCSQNFDEFIVGFEGETLREKGW